MSMFPIGDDNSGRRSFPVVTFGLIALNALFFFLELGGGDAFVKQWAFVPSRFLAQPAADFPTLFTSMFMHAGWLHLGGNMLYLWIFGDNVEDRLGHGLFTAFYLLCGLAATFAQLMAGAASNVPNLGASGAIAGVLGAYIILFPQGRVSVLQRGGVAQMPALMVIGFWIVGVRGRQHRRGRIHGAHWWVCRRMRSHAHARREAARRPRVRRRKLLHAREA
jgi:membrane associated rhomboid family serine protease